MTSLVVETQLNHVLPSRRRLDPEDAKRGVLSFALQGFGPTQIANAMGWTGKNARITARRYIDKLIEEGKLQATDTGRVLVPEAAKVKLEYVKLQQDAFAQIPAVAEWVRDMLTRREGKPKKTWKASLNKLYFFCNGLKVRPEQLYTPIHNPNTLLLMSRRQTAEYFLADFAVKFPAQSVSNGYVLAVRDFTAMVGEVAWPRGRGGVASGKKRNYGIYAHVKLAPGQFEKGSSLCEENNDLLLRDFFEFGVETGSRKKALLATKVSDFEVHDTYATVKVHESKTEGHGIADWIKGIYTPRTFEHIRARIEKCKVEGRELLFVEESPHRTTRELNAKLKLLYRAIGVTDPYPYAHSIHTLRHFCAHYWLELTDYDYTVVKSQIGEKTTEVLEDAYGRMPPEIRDRKIRAAVQTIGVSA